MAIEILSGMFLTPARLNALAPSTARRTTDATVTNSAALVDGLSVATLPNAEYDVEVFAVYEAPVANDLKVAFSWPSGSMTWGMVGLISGATTVTGDLQPFAFGAPAVDQAFNVGGGGAGNQLVALLRGTYVAGLIGGSLKFRFAQAVAGAGTSAVLKAGSTMQLRRIA